MTGKLSGFLLLAAFSSLQTVVALYSASNNSMVFYADPFNSTAGVGYSLPLGIGSKWFLADLDRDGKGDLVNWLPSGDLRIVYSLDGTNLAANDYSWYPWRSALVRQPCDVTTLLQGASKLVAIVPLVRKVASWSRDRVDLAVVTNNKILYLADTSNIASFSGTQRPRYSCSRSFLGSVTYSFGVGFDLSNALVSSGDFDSDGNTDLAVLSKPGTGSRVQIFRTNTETLVAQESSTTRLNPSDNNGTCSSDCINRSSPNYSTGEGFVYYHPSCASGSSLTASCVGTSAPGCAYCTAGLVSASSTYERCPSCVFTRFGSNDTTGIMKTATLLPGEVPSTSDFNIISIGSSPRIQSGKISDVFLSTIDSTGAAGRVYRAGQFKTSSYFNIKYNNVLTPLYNVSKSPSMPMGLITGFSSSYDAMYLLSTLSNSIIEDFPSNTWVASGSSFVDLDSDGAADMIIGSPGTTPQGFFGTTTAQRREITVSGLTLGATETVSASTLADVDGDGCADLVAEVVASGEIRTWLCAYHASSSSCSGSSTLATISSDKDSTAEYSVSGCYTIPTISDTVTSPSGTVTLKSVSRDDPKLVPIAGINITVPDNLRATTSVSLSGKFPQALVENTASETEAIESYCKNAPRTGNLTCGFQNPITQEWVTEGCVFSVNSSTGNLECSCTITQVIPEIGTTTNAIIGSADNYVFGVVLAFPGDACAPYKNFLSSSTITHIIASVLFMLISLWAMAAMIYLRLRGTRVSGGSRNQSSVSENSTVGTARVPNNGSVRSHVTDASKKSMPSSAPVEQRSRGSNLQIIEISLIAISGFLQSISYIFLDSTIKLPGSIINWKVAGFFLTIISFLVLSWAFILLSIVFVRMSSLRISTGILGSKYRWVYYVVNISFAVLVLGISGAFAAYTLDSNPTATIMSLRSTLAVCGSAALCLLALVVSVTNFVAARGIWRVDPAHRAATVRIVVATGGLGVLYVIRAGILGGAVIFQSGYILYATLLDGISIACQALALILIMLLMQPKEFEQTVCGKCVPAALSTDNLGGNSNSNSVRNMAAIKNFESSHSTGHEDEERFADPFKGSPPSNGGYPLHSLASSGFQRSSSFQGSIDFNGSYDSRRPTPRSGGAHRF